MRITIIEPEDGEEDEIMIRCRHLDKRLLKLIYAIKAGEEKITVLHDGNYFQVALEEIYYFEAVDNKVFLYLKQDVFEVRYKLYEIEEGYANTDFFRASKSVIINLAKVKQFAPDFGGRFEAQMRNGERLMVSRQYVPALKKRLGM